MSMEPPYPADDRTLINACIKRDLKAWSILITKYSRLVDLAAAGRLRKYGFTLPKEDVEDIRQDVFTAIWSRNKLKDVADLDDISHWLAVVSGNMAIDRIRGSSRRESLKTIPIHEKFKERCLDELIPSKALRAEDDKAEIELAGRIDRAIERLPCRERLMIELHLTHGKTHDEIAGMLGLPRGTVCSRIKRAKDRLRRTLRDLK